VSAADTRTHALCPQSRTNRHHYIQNTRIYIFVSTYPTQGETCLSKKCTVIYPFTPKRSRGSSGSIVSDYGLDDRGSIPGRDKWFFSLTSVSKPALWPTQPPVQWVPGVLSPGIKRGRGVMLTTHPYLVPRSWMSRSYYTSSPPKRLHGV
jgi:hypothetical protein